MCWGTSDMSWGASRRNTPAGQFRASTDQIASFGTPRPAALVSGIAIGLSFLANSPAVAQDEGGKDATPAPGMEKGTKPLPEIKVTAKKQPPKQPVPKRATTPQTANVTPAAAPSGPEQQGTPAEAALDNKMKTLDQERENLLPKIGASTATIDRDAIVSLPQADNTPIDKVILQLPGVSYDSAVSNPNFHVRNEYANVQFRINGVVLPEGVSSLGPFLDTNFIGSMSLLTGTLPAQYGLRTPGVLDITSRSFATPGGEVSLYGGSRQTFTPSFDYGGSVGNSEYFITARGNWTDLGLENPTPSINALHDQTQQGKFFGYASTLLDDSTRLSVISAESYSAFQIPNNPGQTPLGDFGPANYNSSALNEREYDTYVANIIALQTHGSDGDAQLAVYSRYADIHFVPDVFGDLVFNDVASNVERRSMLTGVQGDASYIAKQPTHVARGFRGQRRADERQRRGDRSPRGCRCGHGTAVDHYR
jgi:hypothetical protein